MNKKIKKLLVTITTGIALTLSTSLITFATTGPFQLSNLQKYKLIRSYTIKNTSQTETSYDAGINVDAGDILNSDYITNIQLPTSIEGNINVIDGKYEFTMPLIKTFYANDTKKVSIVQNFETGKIEYNIDKTKITDNFSELPNYQYYLRESGKVQVNDPAIQQKAKELTDGLNNPYDKAYSMFAWVMDNVRYVDGEHANKGALSALTYKEGVCQDYSQLFVALCRASGIPARTVSGYRNQTVDNTTIIDLSNAAHMWTEVYIPPYGWIIAEPTASIPENYFGKQLNQAEHIAIEYEADAEIGREFTFSIYGNNVDLINKSYILYKIPEEMYSVDSLVEKAEQTKLEADITLAKNAVNALDDNNELKKMFLSRLADIDTAIKDEIIAKERQAAIDNATNLLEKAESSKLLSDYNTVLTAINSLENSNDKSRLIARLNKLKETIDIIQMYLPNIINYLEQAESSKLQADVDIAKSLISSLPEGADKTSLNARLDVVQKAIDDTKTYAEKLANATAAVVKAEGSKLQADVDTARTLVNSLNGTDKTSLNTRLDVVQKAIDDTKTYAEKLANTTTAVEKAEGSKLQADVDTARTLVNSLNDSDKAPLNARLDAVQKAIDETKTYAEKLANATTAVVKAESSKLQANVDTARALVNTLNDSDKATLGARLDAVQKAIDDAKAYAEKLANATAAVEKAEGSNLQADVDTARTLVNSLNGTDKTSLNARLDAVQKAINDAKTYAEKLANATAAVAKAESSKLQADVDTARTLVNSLNDSDKAPLNARLDTVQKAIDDTKTYAEKLANATTAVAKAEGSRLQADIDSARVLVNGLNDTDKAPLNARLDAVQKAIDETKSYVEKLANATNAVVKAENSQLQSDVNNARMLVNVLKDIDRINLNARLDAVQRIINNRDQYIPPIINIPPSNNEYDLREANKLVEKTVNTMSISDFKIAMEKVTSLNNSSDKTKLYNKLENILRNIVKDERYRKNKEVQVIKELLLNVDRAQQYLSYNALKEAQSSISNLNGMNLNGLQQMLQEQLQTVENKIHSRRVNSKFTEQIDYPYLETEEVNKTWNVTFNTRLDKSTVNNNNIIVKNSKGQKINCIISYDNNELIVTPVGNYEKGEEYQIYITNKVKSKDGKNIKDGFYVIFKIV